MLKSKLFFKKHNKQNVMLTYCIYAEYSEDLKL